jgi:hypothetical protein
MLHRATAKDKPKYCPKLLYRGRARLPRDIPPAGSSQEDRHCCHVLGIASATKRYAFGERPLQILHTYPAIGRALCDTLQTEEHALCVNVVDAVQSTSVTS